MLRFWIIYVRIAVRAFPANWNILCFPRNSPCPINTPVYCIVRIGNKKFIKVYGNAEKSQLILTIENSFDGSIKKSGDKFYSSKRDDFGIGIESVKAAVNKYNGMINISHTDSVFTVSLILFY